MPDEEQDEQASGSEPVVSEADQKLLKRIREDYSYCLDYWREVRDEYGKDMEFVAGHSFTAAEVAERNELGAPVVQPDEISQYLNQAINNLRQNKRAVKVNPKGKGATDKDAERRAAIIRGIEYQSNAQAAYTTGFESTVNGSFGAWRINLAYLGKDGYEVEPRIKRIPNALTVLFDPNAREADRSDQELCFVADSLRKTEFARKYPSAKKRSFTPEDVNLAPEWLKGENIVIAEAWYVEKSKRKKIQAQRAHEQEPSELYEDELGKGEEPEILNERVIEERKVVQYITNGLEILETNKWVGSWIPIIGVFGKELYRVEGGRTKLEIHSLVRLARDPQKMLAFVASQEAEEFGMAPRAPFVAYKGQITGAAKDAWANAHKIRRAYLEVEAVTDPTTGQLLPLPSRPQFTPNIQAYQLSRESWRRAVQAAMGISPLPTAAQRQNEKSGVALEHIKAAEQVGSFHFTDNFDRALENTGRQLNELITLVMNTPRQVGIRNPDETHALLQVTTQKHLAGSQPPPQPGQPAAGAELSPEQVAAQAAQQGDNDYLVTDRGEFDVTISTGPNSDSQRDEQGQFVDTIVANLAQLPPPGSPQAKILALAIKMKNYGPLADEIVAVLDPQQDENAQVPPQAQAKMAQMGQQLQQLDALAKQLTQEKEAKTLEYQAKKEIVQIQEQTKVLIEQAKLETQRAIAEIQTKAQDARERAKLDADLDSKLHVAAHERGMQAEDHAQAAAMGAQQHEQALAQQDAGHQQALEQGDQAAANQAALAQQTVEQQAAQAQPEGAQ